MSHVYITDNGSVMSVNGGRYLIKQKNDLLRSIPKETVESVCIFGNSTITTSAIQQLLSDGIPVNFFSSKGRYFGVLQSINILSQKTNVKHQQFKVFDDENFCLELTKQIIAAKIHNQKVMMLRLCDDRAKYDVQFEQMSIAERKLKHSETRSEVMGFEGAAAKAYFHVVGQNVESDFRFSKRTRRPPADAFNSMLSLGYTLLSHESIAALQTVGLDPYFGFLHAERNGGASLTFDLIEEWRVPIIDAVVTSLVNGHEIGIDDFEDDYEGHAIYLTNQGMRKFLKKYERKMATKTKYLDYSDADSLSFRDSMFRQCKALLCCIKEKDPSLYKPFRIR